MVDHDKEHRSSAQGGKRIFTLHKNLAHSWLLIMLIAPLASHSADTSLSNTYEHEVFSVKVQMQLKLNGATTGIAWSEDGTKLAAYSNYGQHITIWDARGNVLNTLTRQAFGPFVGSSLEFLQDSNQLLTPPASNTPQDQQFSLSIWDIQKGTVIRNINGTEPDKNWGYNWAGTYVISNDKQTIALTTEGPITSYISLFSSTLGQLIRQIPVGPSTGSASDSVRSLGFSYDGHYLAAGTIKGKVLLFNPTSGHLERTIYAYGKDSAGIATLAFSPDGSEIATGANIPLCCDSDNSSPPVPPGSGPVRVWRVEDGNYVTSYPGRLQPIRKIAWEPTGRFLAFVGNDSALRIWDPSTPPDAAYVTQLQRGAMSMAFSRAGDRLAVCNGNQVTVFNISRK
jgi:WD40 repeat protein